MPPPLLDSRLNIARNSSISASVIVASTTATNPWQLGVAQLAGLRQGNTDIAFFVGPIMSAKASGVGTCMPSVHFVVDADFFDISRRTVWKPKRN